MLGGVYGGGTINHIKETAGEATIKQVTEAYTNHTGKAPGVYIASIENGTERII
jgi:galactokinase